MSKKKDYQKKEKGLHRVIQALNNLIVQLKINNMSETGRTNIFLSFLLFIALLILCAQGPLHELTELFKSLGEFALSIINASTKLQVDIDVATVDAVNSARNDDSAIIPCIIIFMIEILICTGIVAYSQKQIDSDTDK